MNKKFLITGGAGFIGSALIRYIIENTNHKIVNVDKLTYAGNLASLSDVEKDSRYDFEKIDICHSIKIKEVLKKHQPDIIIHLAAETHVDRSIEEPDKFIQTNIVGTYILLKEARNYWLTLEDNKKKISDFIMYPQMKCTVICKKK